MQLGKAGAEGSPGSESMSLALCHLPFSQCQWNPLPSGKCLSIQTAGHRDQGSSVIQQKEQQRKRRRGWGRRLDTSSCQAGSTQH